MKYVNYIGCLLAWTPFAALAQSGDYRSENPNYEMPNSPELFPGKSRPGEPAEFGAGAFAGFGLGVGQSRPTEPDANPDFAWSVQAEVGYEKGTGNWSHFEGSGVLMSGKIGHGDAELPIAFGALARLGYGYSLGASMKMVWRVGIGVALAGYEEESQGVKVETKDAMWGNVIQASGNIIAPMGSSVSLVGGITWSHYAFNLDKVEIRDGDTVSEADADKNLNFNVPEMNIGLRFSL